MLFVYWYFRCVEGLYKPNNQSVDSTDTTIVKIRNYDELFEAAEYHY